MKQQLENNESSVLTERTEHGGGTRVVAKDEFAGRGTREWSEHSFNMAVGCEHDCLYCYARGLAIRFGRISSCAAWNNSTVLPEKVAEASHKFNGTVMFPTTHDITPQNVEYALRTLRNLLEAGNDVLCVSKPHLAVVERLCLELTPYRSNLQFRFTLGSPDAATCALWEPGAPAPEERIASLRHAFEAGFRTSVSMEPMLSGNEAMCQLVDRVELFVRDTIWLGKLNGGIPKVFQERPEIRESLVAIRAGQSDEQILKLHDRLAGNAKIRWKDSIKKVLREHGRLPEETVPQTVGTEASEELRAKRSAAAKKAWETMRKRERFGQPA